jgi:hypothetical protein
MVEAVFYAVDVLEPTVAFLEYARAEIGLPPRPEGS